MQVLDWIIVASYFVLSLIVGLYYSKRAGKNISEFFLSGRNLPWWLAGTSMVATTFAADTPLAVTELVAKNGIAGNWLWWNFLFGSMLTVFFFARLWRRAGIMTDVEFVELRYSGNQLHFCAGLKHYILDCLLTQS
jgi:solute:Na+ symporter, SSS family